MQRGVFTAVLIALALTLAANRAAAAAPSTAPATIERGYDVRDLMIDIPNFDADLSPALGPTTRPVKRTTGSSKLPNKTRQQVIDDLEHLIMDEVDPTSWQDRGGTIGSMQQSNGHLTITQTPANQDAILALLQSVRETRAIQITLEVRFLTGDAAFKALERISPAKHWLIENDVQTWPAYLDSNQVQVILGACTASKDGTIVTGPRLTLFDGQRAYVVVARQTAYISDFVPGRPTDADPYKPVIDMAGSGLLLDAQTRASADRRQVIVMLRPQTASLIDLTPALWPKSPPDRKDLTIQVPHMAILRAEMTTSIPDNHTAIFRLRPHYDPPSPKQPVCEPVMVLVHPIIIQQKTNVSKPAAQ